MIALAVCWLLLFRASMAAGSLILQFLAAPREDDDQWFIAFWVGLVSLAAAALAIVLAAPAYYAAPLLLLGLHPHLPTPPRWFWPVAAAMTYTASSPIRLYDTALYHQPAIDWMSSEGLLPGLALVHFRFGFSSSWLALTSVFDAGPLASRASAVVTGLALTVALVQWISVYHRNNSPASRFYLAGFPLLLLFFFAESAIVSPSPNLGAALAVFNGIWLLLRSPSSAATLVLAAGALAIKLSAAPLLLVALWRSPRQTRAFALAGALVVPFVAANVQTTGCPVFPSTLACMEPRTGLPKGRVRQIAHETLNWARYGGPYPPQAPFFSVAWIPHNLRQPRSAIVAGLVVAALLVILMRRQFHRATAAAALGSAYVCIAAPDPRFGASFLLALPALAIPSLPLPNVGRSTLTGLVALLLTAGAYCGELVSDRNLPDARYRAGATRLLLPAPAWRPDSVVEFTHNGEVFHRPAGGDRCGVAPRPCTPYQLEPALRRCGRGYCR